MKPILIGQFINAISRNLLVSEILWCTLNFNVHFYRPQRSWAKVIFLHLSVILTGGGVSLQFLSLGWSPIFRGGVSPNFFSFFFFQFFPPQKISPNFFFFFFQFFFPQKNCCWMHQPPPPPPTGTVNARPVRILLECILVNSSFSRKNWSI